jgi:hypothetical protein
MPWEKHGLKLAAIFREILSDQYTLWFYKLDGSVIEIKKKTFWNQSWLNNIFTTVKDSLWKLLSS